MRALAKGDCLLAWDANMKGTLATLSIYDFILTQEGRTPMVFPLPVVSGEGAVATVETYLAANSDSENLAQAYDFIRFAMDYNLSTAGELHVSNKITETHLAFLAEGQPMDLSEGGLNIPAGRGLSEPIRKQVVSAVEGIQKFILPDDAITWYWARRRPTSTASGTAAWRSLPKGFGLNCCRY